jgi:hypothetical protein
MLLAPRCELPEVQGVGVSGETAVAGQETGERWTFSVGEQRLDLRRNRAGGVDGGHGDLPGSGQSPAS